MEFIFWQGIISIHQKAFLEALAVRPGVTKVLLVVAEEITPYRKDMGWEAPAIDHVTIITAPPAQDIKNLVAEHKDAVHIMGGIRVGSMMATALDECIKHKCRLGIMTEPYNKAGLKGALRSMKYQYYRQRYFGHIQFILAIGRMGVTQYKDLGYDEQHLFPWAYFMSIDGSGRQEAKAGAIKRIIYAGRLEEGKGIYRFAEKLTSEGDTNYQLDIYGTGPDEEKLKALAVARGDGRISFFPFLKYEELLRQYAAYDWVVLPSTQKDGWGVIVSEGLLNGLKAICSNICGVSWVIKEGVNGLVFDWEKEGSCTSAIRGMLGNDSFATPGEIAASANRSISGDAGADYFMKIIDCVYHEKERPGIPWLTPSQ